MEHEDVIMNEEDALSEEGQEEQAESETPEAPAESAELDEDQDDAGEEKTGESEETDPLVQAQAEAQRHMEGWQRERAAFANYKKRVERERAEVYQQATFSVLLRLIPILDDFNRAAENIPEDKRDAEWIQGIMLILKKFEGFLKNEGVEEIDALGKPFDPNEHEGIGEIESEEYESGHVAKVLAKGYKYGDRVLRPALVQLAS
jgi:molecular chaperone GrpE